MSLMALSDVRKSTQSIGRVFHPASGRPRLAPTTTDKVPVLSPHAILGNIGRAFLQVGMNCGHRALQILRMHSRRPAVQCPREITRLIAE